MFLDSQIIKESWIPLIYCHQMFFNWIVKDLFFEDTERKVENDKNKYVWNCYLRCEHIFGERWIWHQGSISSTFYEQLYLRRSQKCKKNSQVVSLFALLGSEHAKAVLRTLMKLIPGFRATNTLLNLNLNTFTNCYSVCTRDLDKLNLVMVVCFKD